MAALGHATATIRTRRHATAKLMRPPDFTSPTRPYDHAGSRDASMAPGHTSRRRPNLHEPVGAWM